MGLMVSAGHVFCLLSWMLALAWLWQAVAALRGMPCLPELKKGAEPNTPQPRPPEGLHLTVIVPARNEESAIEATLRSLLASTGLQLEIIAVDDRSTDRTGHLMDEVAVQAAANKLPHRLHVIHISKLPQGWLGKPHAMAIGAQRATASWILFTDGDVLFHSRALELAMREALAASADHLILVPTLILKTIGERAMLAAMQVLSQWTIRLWMVSDPRARDSIGVGGFNLVRREVYAQLGGFEALRMEVLDDLSFGWRVKRAGFSQRVVLGPGLVRIRWIEGALSVIHLVEKNGFAIFRYQAAVAGLACIGLAVQAVLPIAALAFGGWTMAAGIVTYVSIGLAYAANRRVTKVSPWTAVLFAPAVAIITFSLLRSTILALVRQGIDWRGTRYSLSELRRNVSRSW